MEGRVRQQQNDVSVIMLVANPTFKPHTVSTLAATRQVAPTILKALGLSPIALDAVRAEGTQVLSEVEAELERR